MIYTDILIEKKIKEDVIKLALAKMFEVEQDEIIIIWKIEDMPPINKYKIVCYIENVKKDISMLVSFYMFDKKTLDRFNLNEFCFIFSKELQTTCYLPSESENPFELIKFTSDGDKALVYFDANAYDFDGEYLII